YGYYQSYAFSPATVTLNPGERVSWVNVASHTVTSTTGLFDSTDDFSFTFAQTGTYDYYCRVHGDQGMRGQVVVTAPSPTASPSPTATPTPRPATPTSVASPA